MCQYYAAEIDRLTSANLVLAWIWRRLANGQPPDAIATARIRPVLAALASLLDQGAAIIVHCSAGIHRTGIFGYALLRQVGLESRAVREKLAELRG